MSSHRVGVVALLVGCTLTAVGLLVYEAWWTFAFAIGGVTVALLARRGAEPRRSLAMGLQIAGSMFLVMVGIFMVFGSQFAPATPCADCWNPGPAWLAAGLGSIAIGVGLAILARRQSCPHDEASDKLLT